MSTAPFDVIIIGGGAAGMMCALTAGQRGRRVALLERNDRPGQKIAISGGGRCNFTNIYAGADNYLSANPDFCRSALARYTPEDFIALVEKHGIAYHEKKLGQQFCDRSSRSIIEMLLAECAAAGVEIRTGCTVRVIEQPDRFRLATSSGELECEALVIATGGLSFPKLGATDFGYRIARQFGLRVTELRPGLVPLTFTPEDREAFQELSGVALPVSVRHNGADFEEAALFTHRGLSGPAILQISSYWRENQTLTFDLLPGIRDPDWLARERATKTSLPAILAQHWPRRLADSWCERYAPRKPLAHFSQSDLTKLERLLHHWPLDFSGTEGYPKAEVTLGGIDTGALSSKTMEARTVRGLFFIGEVVDVTGWLGGYNFQWAWASGHAAGLVV
ncbi:MAG: NAD(P)/FAD-dependent oxidoreductase [Terrimicrobiaceae bacterium]